MSRRLPPLPTTRDILRMYGIRAKKRLSQNFLLDPRALDRFARVADVEGKTVVEVGPGPGGITRALLGQGARGVHVIEKDPRFVPSLEMLREASGGRVYINLGDCLKYNMSKIFPAEIQKPWSSPDTPDLVLCGNLPFNVATPFIIRLLRDMQERKNLYSHGRVPLLLTFQHEVAERMIAPPGAQHRCRLSVFCQNVAEVRLRYTLPGGAFVPPPDVDVGVVSFLPLRTPYVDLPFPLVERIVTTLFHGKQKRLSNTAVNLFPCRYERRRNADELLFVAGVDPSRKAISLNMDEIEAICMTYRQMIVEHPILENFVYPEVKHLLMDSVVEKHARLEMESGEEESYVTGEIKREEEVL